MFKGNLDYTVSLRTAHTAGNPVSMTTKITHNVQHEVQLSLLVCKAFRPELISGVLLMSGRKDYYEGIFTALGQSVHLALLPWEFGASLESILSTGCMIGGGRSDRS